MIGTTLSHYRIVSELGRGGMGVVYRAHDERLHRDVAIKVLAKEVATNPGRLARFENEAQAVAQLAHPNILEIWDFGQEDGVTYAVTELLEGEDLRQRIPSGGMSWKKAAEIGSAIADGLAAAHGKGIVHRDLKPENIFITSDGRVKILDFGLAQMKEPVREDAETATLTPAGTVPGTVMGTVGYMSPEQVRGKPADARSDIFALGCVLYEMLSGRRAFSGETGADTQAAILNEEPLPLTSTGVTLPAELERSINRCLEKSPEARFQSASDLAFNLRSITTDHAIPMAKPGRGRKIRWALAAGSLIVIGAIAAVLALLGLFDRPAPEDEHQPIRSIALLPLENLTGDPEQAYFVDGLHDELIATFAQISAFDKVIARTSVMTFRNTDTPIREIGEQLKVAAVLEGSVRQFGDTVRVTLQLVDARSESHLWADSFERDLGDILRLQSEVAGAVAEEVRLALTPEEKARLAAAPPVNRESQDSYFKALFNFRKQNPEGFARAIELFEHAIAVDPEYAPAHAGLADSYSLLGYWGVRPPAIMYEAKMAALKAIELDDTLAGAHISLGLVLSGLDRDWAAAEDHLRMALELEPRSASGHVAYSRFLIQTGRLDEAIAEAQESVVLDPLNLYNHRRLGSAYYFASRYDEAIDVLARVLEERPNYNVALFDLMATFAATERYDDAMDFLERFVAAPGWGWDTAEELVELRHARAVGGWSAMNARRAVQLETMMAERLYFSPAIVALVHAAAGHRDETLEWLEKAETERDPILVNFRLSHFFDPFRDEPRFQEIIRRMNLPEN